MGSPDTQNSAFLDIYRTIASLPFDFSFAIIKWRCQQKTISRRTPPRQKIRC